MRSKSAMFCFIFWAGFGLPCTVQWCILNQDMIWKHRKLQYGHNEPRFYADGLSEIDIIIHCLIFFSPFTIWNKQKYNKGNIAVIPDYILMDFGLQFSLISSIQLYYFAFLFNKIYAILFCYYNTMHNVVGVFDSFSFYN